MNKETFNYLLRKKLKKHLSKLDIEKSINYFNEMIDDAVEDGFSEEEAISNFGTIDNIINQIVVEHKTVPKNKTWKFLPNRSFSALEIILLIICFPIWFSLLMVAFGLFFSLIMMILGFIVGIIGFFIWGILMIISIPFYFSEENIYSTLFTAGTGFITTGFSLFIIYGLIKLKNLFKNNGWTFKYMFEKVFKKEID